MSEYTSSVKRFCSVFRSSKKKEMYIYVDRKQDLTTLPEALMAVFGEPVHVLDMLLTPQKKLARVEAQKVLESISEQGFYLQIPPAQDQELAGEAVKPKDTLHG